MTDGRAIVIARPKRPTRGGTLSELVPQIVRGISADLKDAIRDEVESENTNMNDLLVGILARRFKVAFEPTGRRSASVGASADLILRMPSELRVAIKVRAAEHDSTQRDVIVKILSEHFGTRFSSAPRARAAAA